MAAAGDQPGRPALPGGAGPGSDPKSNPIAQYKSLFAALDPQLPLVLMPVRLETRFSPAGAPPELTVRIFPDTIHADGHQPGLTAAEQELGRAFWERTWRAGGGAAEQDAAFAWLAGQAGPWRAAWIARTLTPVNPAQAPTAPVPDDEPLKPPPRVPDVQTRSS